MFQPCIDVLFVIVRKCAVVLTKVLYLLNHVRHCFKLLYLYREEGKGA